MNIAEQRTVLAYKLIQAFEQDQRDKYEAGEIKKKMSKRALQCLINETYPDCAKELIYKSNSTGQRLLAGAKVAPTDARTTKKSLLAIIETMKRLMDPAKVEEIEQLKVC